LSSGETAQLGSDEKLRRLQAVTDAALSQLGLEDLLAELLERTRDLLQADTAAVLLLDQSGLELIATAASGHGQKLRPGARIPVGQGFAGEIVARGEPVVVPEVGRFERPVLADGIASALGVPMLHQGRAIGVLHIGSVTGREFTTEDVETLQLVADRASLATQARLSRLDRATALALQRSLLPARPPTIAGLDVAARYLPGAQVGVGGDWYDLFELPSGHIGIVIGDVAGSGLHAAVVMGRIRSALRAYALETDDPADVLTRLDRKVQLFEPDAMATVLYAVLDPSRTNLTLSNAGHVPPVIAMPQQPAALVPVDPDLPIGAHRGATRRNMHATLQPDACLFLYTDGLIERRRRPLRTGIEALLDALPCGPADAMCTAAIEALLADYVPTDDIAILAVRRGRSADHQ
jgi:serine phosphatase RsbU (regulator of sigma subunit)